MFLVWACVCGCRPLADSTLLPLEKMIWQVFLWLLRVNFSHVPIPSYDIGHSSILLRMYTNALYVVLFYLWHAFIDVPLCSAGSSWYRFFCSIHSRLCCSSFPSFHSWCLHARARCSSLLFAVAFLVPTPSSTFYLNVPNALSPPVSGTECVPVLRDVIFACRAQFVLCHFHLLCLIFVIVCLICLKWNIFTYIGVCVVKRCRHCYVDRFSTLDSVLVYGPYMLLNGNYARWFVCTRLEFAQGRFSRIVETTRFHFEC